MSEKNYINESVVPRMPKSVSNEQLFVFVPVATASIAGIFKIDINDFDASKLPVLSIKQDATVTKNGTGFVRGGAVYSFVNAIKIVLEKNISDLQRDKQDKQDDNLQTSSKNVVGAINELNNKIGDANSGLTKRVDDLESDVSTLKTTVGNANSGLVKQANDNSEAIRTINNTTIPALDKRVTSNTNRITDLEGNVKDLSSGQTDLKTRMTTAENELDEHTQDIADLMTKDGEFEASIKKNAQDIAKNTSDIESNSNDIQQLKDTAYGGETPIGTYPSSTTLPTSEQLTAFVQQEVSRAPKLGDVVLFTQIIAGATDKSYKFMYTATGWSNYVIPTVENATNTDKGILQGTLGDTSGNVQVSIVAGKVADILVKDGNTYKSVKTVLDNLAESIANTNATVAANKTAAEKGIAEAKAAAAAVIKKYNNVEFTFVSSDDNTITNFPCKYTANIEDVTLDNVADVYFSALQIPLEIFSSYVLVEAGKVSIFATTKVNYPTSVTVPTVRIS